MLCNTAAAASAFKDDVDSDYLQASISGKGKALKPHIRYFPYCYWLKFTEHLECL